MKITKVYSPDCGICAQLGRLAEPQAIDRNWEYEELDLGDLALNPSPMRDYFSEHHVDNEGMVDLPVYVLSSTHGEILFSGVVQDEEQLSGLFFACDVAFR